MCGFQIVSLLFIILQFSHRNEAAETTTSSSKNTKSTTSPSMDVYDPKNSYCFEFTWLGPTFDNTIEFDQTCEDYLEDKRVSTFIPCRQPLVITNDSTLPNMNYLWNHFKTRVVRRQSKGQVCVKYSFKFNNEVTNITYMRSKVFAENEGPVTSGCYTQMHGGTESELCVCEPTPGDYMPCNEAYAIGRIEAISTAVIGSLLCMFTWLLI